VTKLISVPFRGPRAESGELTWGQIDIWTAMQRQRSSLPFGGAFLLPPGTTVADIAADLRFLMGRHDSLRTRLRLRDDGLPRQVVAQAGEIALEVVDPGDADPEEVAWALYRQYEQRDFDYASDWPIRWAVVARGDQATHLVTAICHIAADGAGAMNLLDDLARRDPATGQAAAPVTALQPVELARLQQAPAARRQNAAALAFWEQTLRAVPARRFPGPGAPAQPRYWVARLDSPAGLLAARIVAARERVSTSVVLLAAYAVQLTRVTGIRPALILAVVGNRFRRDLADVVSPTCSPTPCVIDAGNVPFSEVVTRTWRATIKGYKLAYYNPAEREDLEARIARERGERVDISCYYNDRRLTSRDQAEADQPVPTADQVRAALPRSEVFWGPHRDLPHDRCFVSIDNVPDSLSCEIKVDTCYLSPADMKSCLHGIENLLLRHAGLPQLPSISTSLRDVES
jgi:Condensation domain